jgi:hypothetical protein
LLVLRNAGHLVYNYKKYRISTAIYIDGLKAYKINPFIPTKVGRVAYGLRRCRILLV